MGCKLVSITMLLLFTCVVHAQDNEKVRSSIPLKGVVSVQEITARPGFYSFLNKKGEIGLWDNQKQEVIHAPARGLVIIPGSLPDVWVFCDQQEFTVTTAKDGFVKWSAGTMEELEEDSISENLRILSNGGGILFRDENKVVRLYENAQELLIRFYQTGPEHGSYMDIYDWTSGKRIGHLSGSVFTTGNGYFESINTNYPSVYSFFKRHGDTLIPVFKGISRDSLEAHHLQTILGNNGQVLDEVMHGHYRFEKDNQFGIADLGTSSMRGVVLEPEYDLIEAVEWMHCFVQKGEKLGMFSLDHGLVLEPKYSKLELIGESPCNQYVLADSSFYRCDVWDCEIFQGLVKADLNEHKGLAKDKPVIRYQIVDGTLTKETQQPDEMIEDDLEFLWIEEEMLPGRESIDKQKAKVIAQAFTNKAGREYPDIVEYFLEFGGRRHFIKFSESRITPEQLKPYAGKTILFDGELVEGLWDTDDPNVQSRVGEYLVVYKLLEK